MYNVTKFCKTLDLNLEKSAALLSQFHLTHLFFTSKLDMSAEKVYTYFKDLTMCHSLPVRKILYFIIIVTLSSIHYFSSLQILSRFFLTKKRKTLWSFSVNYI